MITEHNKMKISLKNKSMKNKKEKEKEKEKRQVTSTSSLTNMKTISHKTKTIYESNISIRKQSNSIHNINHKNKLTERKKQKIKNNNKKNLNH